jgi:predicted CXXCH cytochrome family protein
VRDRLHPRLALLLAAVAWVSAGAAAQPQVLDSTGSTAPAPKVDVPRAGCVTAECHPGVKDFPYLHGPLRVNGCDGCHELTDPEQHTYRFLSEREGMCALCHIPETIEAPYSHAPFKEGDCLSCHNPHGGHGTRLLRGERYVDACSSCHEDMTGAHDEVHGPASVGACGACHQPHTSQLPKLLNAEGRDLCLRCHVRTGLEIEAAPVVHQPALGDCRVCHDPHATDNPAILVEKAQTLCERCHTDIAATAHNASVQHEAVTSNRSCLNCHEAHAGEHASLLKQDVQQLCFECHNQAVEMPDGSHLINMKELIEGGASLHGAITERGCAECHEIHGGGNRRLLTNEYPSDLYYPFAESTYALCFSCHDSALVLLSQTDSATGFRNGATNLHYVHVNNDEKGRSCNVCHDAHAASRDKHIRDSIPFGPAGWLLPIKYESLDDGGRCAAGCHQVFEYNRVKPLEYPEIDPEQAWDGADLVPGSRIENGSNPGDRQNKRK